MASAQLIPIPTALKVTSNYIAVDWKRFNSQWRNYEIATDLTAQTTQKRAAVFLACVGTEAYEIFQTMEFEDDNDRADIDKIVDAFQKYCVGEVNVTYERYLFNKRTQNASETFDNFLSDLRRLVKSCDYGNVEECILRDRIVVVASDNSTRRKLLQKRNLDLNEAIDICKASELASKQLRAMSSPDEVNALKPSYKRSTSRSRDAQRS